MAGSGRAQKNKAHKTRFSSKSSRRDHKISGITKEKSSRKTVVHHNAKELRLQRNKNIRDNKRALLLSEKRGIKGEKSAPRILVLVPLDDRVQTSTLKQRILSACSDGHSFADEMETENSTFGPVCVSKHNFRISVLEAPLQDLQTCLHVVKVADIVALVCSVAAETDGNVYDKNGKVLASMLKAQGLPNTVGVVMGLEEVPTKKRTEIKKLYHEKFEAEFPQIKTFDVSSSQDAQQIVRHISEQRPSHIQWRSLRPFVMAEQLSFKPDMQSPSSGTLLLSGYVREQSLSVNQLVHISGLGDFQLEKMEILGDPCPLARSSKKSDGMAIDEEKGIFPDLTKQEALVVENIPDSLAGEQTWPTEEELSKADLLNKNKHQKQRKLPKGTSQYQASWIVDESDDEGVDEDLAENTEDMQCDEDDETSPTAFEDEGTEADTSEMMDDENLSINQRKEDIQRLKDAVKSDEEFPDEVDTPLDVPARERFAKFRGLKSLRTSPWDPKESLPSTYERIFAFESFNRTMRHVVDKAKNVDDASLVTKGTFVRLHVKSVPSNAATSFLESYRTCPLVAYGLFQHESKMTVLHFSIKKNDNFAEPIKSKETLLFHIGFRSYLTRPIFSTDDINMNKHKYERFLHAGRFSVASVFIPVHFPPAPLIVFKGDAPNLQFVASGSLKNADPDRIILKKIILSGYPLRVMKKKAIVRYMFHNPEDVKWFKPLELWTKYGRRGRILEPVGTHGAMKCVFDGVVQQRDAVCVNLYKRVYPKWPQNDVKTSS